MGWWKKRTTASLLSVALIVPIVVGAMLAEGFRETKVDLHDGGVWVVNRERQAVGRVNTQLATLDVAIGVEGDAQGLDVSQFEDDVLATVGGSFLPVDVALAQLLESREVPAGAMVAVNGPTGAVLDPQGGALWVVPIEGLRAFDDENVEPVAQLGGPARAVVGVDGAVHAVTDGGELTTVPPGGEPETREVEADEAALAITAVGGTPVMLDADGGAVVLASGDRVEIGEHGGSPVLQQPGPHASSVLVATDDALLAVDLGGGGVDVVYDQGTGDPSAPVRVATCTYGAWATRPHYAQHCSGHDPIVGDTADLEKPSSIDSGHELEYRVNRNRVVLNDLTNGALLLMDDDEPEPIENWDEALQQNEQKEEQEDLTNQAEELDCSTTSQRPELKDDTVGTRPGRPVIVRVLLNDTIPDCDVPVVTITAPPAPEIGRADVIEDGSAIQVTPVDDGVVTVGYGVRALDGTLVEATVRVEVRGSDEPNREPVPKADETSVASGETVRHNVLLNDIDPDGDALTLTSVTAAAGAVSFTADGLVTYRTGGGSSGTIVLDYEVQDELGASAASTLEVSVLSAENNNAPIAKNDRVVAAVGQEATVDLLVNDVDLDDDELLLVNVDDADGIDLDWDDRGELRVRADAEVTSTVTYEITDGEAVAQARVRIDVKAGEGNQPPIAVRDDLAARPGVPAVVDLTANDLDLDDDVLVVTGLDVPEDAGLAVELLELHIARVTAPASFVEPVVVRYTVSDGTSTSTGALVVRPLRTAGLDQPPILVDDRATVRAGNATAIPVLRNDVDPEGERLTITGVDAAAEGHLFTQRDELRYEAPAQGPATVRAFYEAQDPAGNPASAEVTIRVLPVDDDSNRPPAPSLIETRVHAGSERAVPIRLVGMDPDGDTVALLGVHDAPTKGHALRTADGFRYVADRGATGTDRFTYKVRDDRGLEAIGEVRVGVVEPPRTNSRPVAVPDRVAVMAGEETEIEVLRNDSDPDGDPLELLTEDKDAPTQPREGELRVHDAGDRLVYRAPGSVGADTQVSVAYTISDGRGGTAQGIVTIDVTRDTPEARAPEARDDAVEPVRPGVPVEVDVLANDHDPDGDVADLQVSVPSFTGATVLDGGRLQVTADRSVTFRYEVTDPQGLTASALVTVPVLESPPPVCRLLDAETTAGESLTIDLLDACEDPAGGDLEVLQLLSFRGGTGTLDGSRAVFTAAPEVRGDAGFAFLVGDPAGQRTTVGGVVVRVRGQNFPPELTASTVELPAGGTRRVELANLVTDLNDEDRHEFTLTGGTTDLIDATIRDGVLEVTADDTARDATTVLGLRIDDGANQVDGELPVRVLPHDGAPPAAVDDRARTVQEKPVTVDVTANDVDPLGGGLTVTVVDAQGGTAEVVGDGLRFSPEAGFFGVGLVTYRVLDETEDATRASSATVRIDVIGRPGTPLPPTGKGGESRVVRLEWGAPAANGAPITGYRIEADNGGGTRESGSNAYAFDGLTNGQAYRFRVAGVNEANAGESDPSLFNWSNWSPPLTPDQVPGIPGAPTLQFEDGAMTVTWVPPANEGTPIVDYQVRAIGGGVETRSVGNVTTYDFRPLQNGTSYAISVRAKNDLDWGEWSPSSTETPAGPPGPVGAIDATRNKEAVSVGGSINLSWDPPADVNGAPIESYEVTSSPVVPSRPRGWTFTPQPGRQNNTIYELQNGVPYSFTIRAKNKHPDLGTPATSAAATPARVPGAPSAPVADPRDGAVALTFAAPADDGGATVTEYRAEAYDGGALAAQGLVASGSPPPATGSLGGLTNGRTYRVRLQACNDVECGPWSSDSNAVVPFGRPSTPSVTLGAVTGTTISWSWTESNGNGRAIRHYEVYVDGRHVGNQTSRSYTGTFGRGETHRLHVIAVNEGDLKSSVSNAPQGSTPRPLWQARVDDYFLGGTWERSTPTSGTWGSSSSPPANGTRWHTNGSTLTFDCRRSAATYDVNHAGGGTSQWTTWLHLQGGGWIRWAAIDVAPSSDDGGPSELMTC